MFLEIKINQIITKVAVIAEEKRLSNWILLFRMRIQNESIINKISWKCTLKKNLLNKKIIIICAGNALKLLSKNKLYGKKDKKIRIAKKTPCKYFILL